MKKNSFVLIIIILSAFIIGVIAFFAFFDKESEIYVESIDRSITFSLGEFKVDSIEVDINYISNQTTFTIENEEAFKEAILSNPNYIDTYEVNGLTVHLFIYQSNAFLLYDENPWYELTTDGALLHDMDILVPFFTQSLISDEMFISYDDDYNLFKSFNDAESYFESISPKFAIIDKDLEVIYLNCVYIEYEAYEQYGIHDHYTLSNNYPIMLSFSNSGIIIEFNPGK